MSGILDWSKRKLDQALSPNIPEYQSEFIKYYAFKTRFAMLGTVGSGKTTVSACMLITAHTRSNDDPDFYCQTVERKSGIRVSASNLRRGIFPPKTIPTGNTTYESGLKIRRKTWHGEKFVHIPIVDVAGEDLQYLLSDFEMNYVPDTINYRRLCLRSKCLTRMPHQRSKLKHLERRHNRRQDFFFNHGYYPEHSEMYQEGKDFVYRHSFRDYIVAETACKVDSAEVMKHCVKVYPDKGEPIYLFKKYERGIILYSSKGDGIHQKVMIEVGAFQT